MTAYCPECGNVICQCEEIKKAERPHLSTSQAAQAAMSSDFDLILDEIRLEREACAAICDEIASRHHKQHYPDLESVADECAGAIRSRSEERF